MSQHTLAHALRPDEAGCTHNMAEIHACVICDRRLKAIRERVDTCGAVCFKRLLLIQTSA